MTVVVRMPTLCQKTNCSSGGSGSGHTGHSRTCGGNGNGNSEQLQWQRQGIMLMTAMTMVHATGETAVKAAARSSSGSIRICKATVTY